MNNATEIREVRYLNKDFTQFRSALIEFAKSYYSDTFNDFDPNDPAMMFIEMASYVGDVLSYYMDSQLKESMLLLAEEKKNVIQLAQALGYRPKNTVPSKGDIEIFQLVPGIGTGENVAPDYRYALKINSGMSVSSTDNKAVAFKTLRDVNFAYSSNYDPTEKSIYQTDSSGTPTFFLLKKIVPIESSTTKTMTETITTAERYKKILLPDTNVVSIDNVTDSDGNVWYEVPYLAQDTILEDVSNVASNNSYLAQYSADTPFLLKYKRVPRRFITRYRSDGKIEMQFGSGLSGRAGEEIIPNPDNVGLTVPTRMNKLNDAWDISNFLYSDAYGQIPTNTVLTIKYSVGGGINSNVVPNSITRIDNLETSTQSDASFLDARLLASCKKSIVINNPSATVGGRSEETIEEIRQNALAYFSAQGRTVTLEDYILRAYSMSQKYGSIAKAYIVQDEQLKFQDYLNNAGIQTSTSGDRIKNPLAMNMYILGYDKDKKLTNCNEAIKQNLATYLNQYRMLTDAINIKNAYVINIGMSYEITVLPNYSAREVMLKVTNKLKDYFNIERWQINQPIVIGDVISLIATEPGVQSVLDVSFHNLFDDELGYSNNAYDIKAATRYGIIYPSMDPSIFEIKNPDSDISGRVTSY